MDVPGTVTAVTRCTKTDKVIYTSKRQANEANRRQDTQGKSGPPPGLSPYRCGSHWHLGHSSRLKDRGTRPARRKATTREKFDAQQWDEATMLLWSRCRDRCESCGKPLGGQMVRHHRQRKGVGGDRLCNLLALHDLCHKQVHEHPEASRGAGLIVSAYEVDPATVPVTLPDGRRWLLDDRGGKAPQP